MNPAINNFNLKELKGRDARLFQEWKELDAVCSKRKENSPNPFKPSLSYIIRRKNAMGLPTEFEIWYRCKSIVGVEDTQPPRKPIFVQRACLPDHQGDGRSGFHQRFGSSRRALPKISDVPCPEHLPLPRGSRCGRVGTRRGRAQRLGKICAG